MDRCANCGEQGFGGHACLRCGVRVGSMPPPQTSATTASPCPADRPAPGAPADSPDALSTKPSDSMVERLVAAASGSGGANGSEWPGGSTTKVALLVGAGMIGLLVVIMVVDMVGTVIEESAPHLHETEAASE